MGVIYPNNWGTPHDVFYPSDMTCFYCSATVPKNGPLVYWDGCANDGQSVFALHPQCAKKLGMHLIQDGHIAHEAGSERSRVIPSAMKFRLSFGVRGAWRSMFRGLQP